MYCGAFVSSTQNATSHQIWSSGSSILDIHAEAKNNPRVEPTYDGKEHNTSHRFTNLEEKM